MGMEQTVVFPPASPPAWDALRSLLAARGFPVQLRMIDGELAFPDETPPETWSELRVGTPQGMITLRRGADRVAIVTWGNADAAMRQAWNAVTWAAAACCGGRVETPGGPVDADAYLAAGDLPPVFRGGSAP